MRFTAGIKDTNGKQLQVNGQRFRVEAVDPQRQTIEISTKGKRFTITKENLLHSDYRWISTVHSLQGATAQYAIFAALEAHGALLSQESWYVAASRAKLEFTAYCTDKAQLRESIQVSKAQRPAMDLIYSSTITPIIEPDFQPINEQAIEVISSYLEQTALESAITQPLTELTRQIEQLQAQLSSPTERVDIQQQQFKFQAFEDLPPYVEEATINAALIPPLTKLTQQIVQLQAQLSSPTEQVDIQQQPINEQAIKVISSYLEQTALESALTQSLTNLTKQLATLSAQLSSSTKQLEATLTNLEQAQSNQATQAVSNYVEYAAIESALVETVLPLFEQFSQYQQQLIQGKVALTSLNHLLDSLTTDRAIETMAGHIEQEVVTNSQLVPALESLIGQLNASQPHLTTALAQLSSAMSNFLEDVASYQAQKPTGAAEPIAEPINNPSVPTASERFSAPSPQLLAAQLQILTDQIFAPDSVYQERGLRIERQQGQLRASIDGESIDLRHPENLAPIVNRLQEIVNEFELLSLYEEFEQAAQLEQAIANLATEIVQLNCGNYFCPGLSVAASDRSMEIQLDEQVVFKSERGFVTRPDDLLQLSYLQLQLASTLTQLQQTIAAQREQQAILEVEQLKAQSKLALTSTITPPTKERDRGFTL